jgi:hypothetical protein
MDVTTIGFDIAKGVFQVTCPFGLPCESSQVAKLRRTSL